ncbi:MAG: protein kinase [Chloracidobacterium sp.]|nr:protein kinase [Chloracidobacterium sp.]
MIDEFEGKIIAEKYRIESILRDSDLGVLYRGWHVMMDKPVTVKILAPALAVDKRFVERFLAEAKTLSQAANQNILNVTDFGTDTRGVSYTVYEAADGETVTSLVERDDQLSISQALNIAKQAASGIASAHSKNLRHGALTPEKIFLATSGENESVKVLDFGIQPVGWNSNTDIEYLSPEQYADTNKGDARSDIYSLGVIIYKMLAGVVPFAGKTTNELKLKHDSEPPAPLSSFRSDLPPDLEPMILSAIAIDPEKRYQSMRAFAEDLELVSGGISVPQKAAAAPTRNIWQTAFIALIGISLLAGALIYATSIKKTDPTVQLQADVGSLPVQPIGPATGAQEESLAKLPAMTDAEIMAVQSSNSALPMDSLPGGDGYNAWANGGAPPIGAPPAQYIPPGGQYYTVDPNGSQFMPQDGGVILVPVPANTSTAVKPSPTPKTQTANTTVQPTPAPVTTPKPLATPPKTDKPLTGQPNKDKGASVEKPAKNSKPKTQ